MRRATFGAAMFVVLTALTVPSAAQAAPDHGSCAEFGANVAGLARALGGDFGATASSVAQIGPGAFPTLVVHPEQQALCKPRP